jgi:hypothetical protein
MLSGAVLATQRPPAGTQWLSPRERSLPDFSVHVQVMNPMVIVPGAASSDVVVQGAARLFSISLPDLLSSGTSVNAFATLQPGLVEAPYLVPFDGFDHLASVPSAGCPPSMLGIGVFVPQAGSIPRYLQYITVSERQFTTRQIDGRMDVTSFVAVPQDTSTWLVGAVGKIGAQDMFGVYQLSACGDVATLAMEPTEFSWRAVDAPGFGENGPAVPKTNGVRLVGMLDGSGGARFFHYDGYQLRQWTYSKATGNASLATIQSANTLIHAVRTDLAFQ